MTAPVPADGGRKGRTGERRYVAMTCRIIGWEQTWTWKGAHHKDRGDAISEGLNHCGSDDFNIGVIDSRTGKLTAVFWMDEDDREQSADEIRTAADQLGLSR
jgi:hypothetical protein